MSGRLAQENAARNPKRTSGAAAALLIGVAVVALFTVFAASIKASVDDQIKRGFAGDLVIDSRTFGFGGFNPQLEQDVSHLSEVQTASGVRFGLAHVNGSDRQLTVIDPATLPDVFDLGIEQGALAGLDEDGVAVSTRYADEHNLFVGDRLDAKYPDGATATLVVAATYKNSDIFGTDFTLGRAAWEPHTIENADSMIVVKLNPGVSIEQGKAAVESVTNAYPTAKVQDRQSFKETVYTQVNQLLALVYVMLLLAIIIALMGIANTLSLSIFERTRELGLLRAVGETRGQLRSMVRWESVIIAVFGTLGGVALGTLCGWALVTAASESGFALFQLPLGSLILVVILGGAAGILAALRPAWRASKLDVLQAIATE